jgi:hypothetical protein
MSTDLTFITNEAGKNLCNRFGVLLGEDTRFFDCLVGYFFVSGFHKLHPALTKTEKIRILVGIKTDRAIYELIQSAKEQQEFILESHAQVKAQLPGEILNELQKSGDSSEIEDGIHKFVEWIKSGKLEIRAFPSERLHAKLYIMTLAPVTLNSSRTPKLVSVLVSVWTLQTLNSLLHTQLEVVAGGGIEPPTQGFSVLCSTN